MITATAKENTNLTICEFDTKKPIPSNGYDFIIKDLDTLKTNNILKLPKFTGRWKIAFVANSSVEIESLHLLTVVQPIEVDAYCSKELYKEYSSVNSKSNYQQCIDLLTKNNLQLDKDALMHLYYGTKGNLDVIESFIKDMLKDGVELVTKRVANKYVVFSRVTYASDVVCSLLVHSNTRVDVRGSSLERYKGRRDPFFYIKALEEFLSPEHAYYAVRKMIFQIYKHKMAYLSGKDLSKLNFKELDIVKLIDTKSILYLYLLVQASDGVPSLTRLFIFMNRNLKGESEHAHLHQEKLITGDTRNHFRAATHKD